MGQHHDHEDTNLVLLNRLRFPHCHFLPSCVQMSQMWRGSVSLIWSINNLNLYIAFFKLYCSIPYQRFSVILVYSIPCFIFYPKREICQVFTFYFTNLGEHSVLLAWPLGWSDLLLFKKSLHANGHKNGVIYYFSNITPP